MVAQLFSNACDNFKIKTLKVVIAGDKFKFSFGFSACVTHFPLKSGHNLLSKAKTTLFIAHSPAVTEAMFYQFKIVQSSP